MRVWAARNENGEISIFAKKPIRDVYEASGENFTYFDAAEDDVEFLEMRMDEDFHSEVTTENSPRRIELSDQDLLAILNRKLENDTDHYNRIREQSGYFNLNGMCIIVGKSYILNHLIGLIEASINNQNGGQQ